MFPKTLILTCLLASATLFAQEPPVKVNVLNVCTPSPEDQKEIAAALARIPKQPAFSADFEIARGRSSLGETPEFLKAATGAQIQGDALVASFVRMRREFAPQSPFSTVQYSFSDDSKTMVETLVLHVRDPKDLVMVSVEDSASSVTSPATMLASSTPASRIKLERFGKSSVVLARCSSSEAGPPPDQTAYEPLFTSASAIMTNYRGLLHVRSLVPEELARTAGAARKSASPKSGKPAANSDHK
jgi:hypothetical protein